jgi:acetyl esterase
MAQKPVLEPEFAPIFDLLATMPPISGTPIAEVRALWNAGASPDGEAVAEVRDLRIPVAGDSVRARLYSPGDTPSGLIVYYHGGGWVAGSIETHDLALRALTNKTGAAILSVDYRLAPEHPFPIPFDDSYTALLWAADHQAELIGPERPIAVGGDSAGGNLAAAVSLAARDRGGPLLAFQLLLYPVIDGRCDSASYDEHVAGGMLNAPDMRWYWSNYADETARLDPLASPCLAASHSDLAPAIVVAAGFDPLRDEAVACGAQLRAAGNDATLLTYETLPHGFFNYLYQVPMAATAFDEIAGDIRRRLAQRNSQ